MSVFLAPIPPLPLMPPVPINPTIVPYVTVGIGFVPPPGPIGPGVNPLVILDTYFAPPAAVPVGWWPRSAEVIRLEAMQPEPTPVCAALLLSSLFTTDLDIGKYWREPTPFPCPDMWDVLHVPPRPLPLVPSLFRPLKFGWWPRPAELLRGPEVEEWYRAAAAFGLPMPSWFGPEGGDAARWYLTGAGSDGGSQAVAAASLGNYRSSSEAERVGVEPTLGTAGLTLALVSGSNYQVPGSTVPPAEGLVATVDVSGANSVRYTAPGSTVPGEAVEIMPGESVTVADGADAGRWVRVTRAAGSVDLRGQIVANLVDQFHNAVGMLDAAEAESAGGGVRYRAVMLRAVALPALREVTLYVGTLGPSKVSAVGALGGAGSGTISFAADAIASWPLTGWARVETAAGALREIVYYSARTNAALTVPAAGRGRLGTAATAGAVTDVVWPVPGIRIGWEWANPRRNGPVQTVASESSAPSGISWSTGIAAAGGVSVGTMHTYQQGAIWIERELPVGAVAGPRFRNAIWCQWQMNGATYREQLAGLYGVQDTDLDRYELVVGSGSAPALEATANETFSALPYTTTLTLGVGTHFVRVRRRNKWGMLAEPIQTVAVRVTATGVRGNQVPSGPAWVEWTAAAGGTFRLRASYQQFADEPLPATSWLVYLRTNGTDPDPAIDTPTVVAMSAAGLGLVWLDASYGPYSAGTVGKVLVRTRRASDNVDSTNAVVYSAVASASGPGSVSGKAFWQRVAQEGE